MAETPPLVVDPNTPEAIALKLFEFINNNEGFRYNTADLVLNMYAECLMTVRDPESRQPKRSYRER